MVDTRGAPDSRHGDPELRGGDSSPEHRKSAEATLFDFVLALERDRARGGVRRQSEYRALFPNLGRRLRSEYQRFTAEEAGAPGAPLGAGGTAPSSSAHPAGASPADGEADGLQPGLGPGRVVRVLGRGGQGEVVLVWDAKHRRHVAVKRLTCAAWRGHEARARLAREARVLRRLDHPDVCRVLAVDTEGPVPYLVMDVVPGCDLGTILGEAARGEGRPELPVKPRTSSDLAVVAGVFARLARALHAAHEAGIVHRDVKPGNVMITPRGAPVLMDFGLARSAGRDTTPITRPGDVLGTRSYMAPELLMGGAASRQSDVYGLGATLFEVLIGRPPRGPGDRAPGRVAPAHGPRKEPLPAARVTEERRVLTRLVTLALEALAERPAARPATAASMASRLDAAVAGP